LLVTQWAFLVAVRWAVTFRPETQGDFVIAQGIRWRKRLLIKLGKETMPGPPTTHN
jgi:hypothetical protein